VEFGLLCARLRPTPDNKTERSHSNDAAVAVPDHFAGGIGNNEATAMANADGRGHTACVVIGGELSGKASGVESIDVHAPEIVGERTEPAIDDSGARKKPSARFVPKDAAREP